MFERDVKQMIGVGPLLPLRPIVVSSVAPTTSWEKPKTGPETAGDSKSRGICSTTFLNMLRRNRNLLEVLVHGYP